MERGLTDLHSHASTSADSRGIQMFRTSGPFVSLNSRIVRHETRRNLSNCTVKASAGKNLDCHMLVSDLEKSSDWVPLDLDRQFLQEQVLACCRSWEEYCARRQPQTWNGSQRAPVRRGRSSGYNIPFTCRVHARFCHCFVPTIRA